MDKDDRPWKPEPVRRANAEPHVHLRGFRRDDPAYPIVSAILTVVPASRWAFARLGADGELEKLLSSGDEERDGLEELGGEFKRQRAASKNGPRIAAALGPMADFESGVTLLFADARSTFGILTLLRTAALGPFTSTEISMLTLALTATTDRLSSLRLHPGDRSMMPLPHSLRDVNAPHTDDSEGSFYVLDRDLQIVLAWSSENKPRVAITGLRTRIAERLPAVLEETVRQLTAGWGAAGEREGTGAARPVPFLVVRTAPMSGPTGSFIGVRIERFQPPNSLTAAATRFHISPREVQVLALLLDGEHLSEIGARLHITSSTVQDHIRSMVEKTGSRNRSDLIARILGWEFTPAPL
jgi:DNA-binding CsgD family transcriptional regulator